ncbi:MAG: hypothetical protein KGD63_10575 [Candidatus Lokiarchaeota archaeon]|nr:hypothetical protein [Candidatus Lokiarchaeota archaeon]
MDRSLLSKILTQMKIYLKDGKSIGDLKYGALFALGQQLEAIFYYLGHELGTLIKTKETISPEKIHEEIKEIIKEFNIGDVEITNKTDEIVQLKLKNHSSLQTLIGKEIKTKANFCSFEAGLLAGIVEGISDVHCFAQELSCGLQTGENFCEFMIVFQKD